MARTKKNGTAVKVPTRPIARVVKYRRVSVKRDDMTTMETQNIDIDKYCDAYGYEVVADLYDTGISAFSGTERPDFEKAIEMIERGFADAIVVFKLDRFCRSISEFWETYQRIEAAGGSFISTTEKFDTAGPFAPILMSIIAAFAQIESQVKSDRAIPMHQYHKEHGMVAGGPRPYGYDKITSKATKHSKGNNGRGAILKIREREAEIIRMAAEWVIEGKGLMAFIAHYQPDSSVANKKMTYNGIRQCLISPTIAGLRVWAENPDKSGFAKGNWEPILDRETWNTVREILCDPARKQSNPTERSYLLSGILTCGGCGYGMHNRFWTDVTSGKKQRRYECGRCRKSVVAATAEDFIMRELFDRVPESKWSAWQSSGKGWDAQFVEAIEERMAFFDKQYRIGKINEIRWAENMEELEAELSAAQNEESLDIPHIPNLREGWNDLTLSERQKVFAQAFGQITLSPAKWSRQPIDGRITFEVSAE